MRRFDSTQKAGGTVRSLYGSDVLGRVRFLMDDPLRMP